MSVLRHAALGHQTVAVAQLLCLIVRVIHVVFMRHLDAGLQRQAVAFAVVRIRLGTFGAGDDPIQFVVRERTTRRAVAAAGDIEEG